MCGIAGIVDLSRVVDLDELNRFTDALQHRGPDGRGIWNKDPRFGLGHRRLSILDLSDNGACPFEYEAPSGAKSVITYNGEVYNFVELKKELEGLGHRFKTATDTEVLAACLAQWGKQGLNKLNGMWAFAFLDRSQNTLLLSRDRFGVKPLYYAIQNNKFYFASELKAFTALKGFTRELNEALVPSYISNSQAIEGSTEHTLFKDVYKLMPGHIIVLTANGQIVKERWWNTRENTRDYSQVSALERASIFRDLFIDATRIRMRSDVPVGCSFSGGIDSTAVASCIKLIQRNNASAERTYQGPFSGFLSAFPGDPLDETEFARLAADEIQLELTENQTKGAYTTESVLKNIWVMEDIYPGIAIPVAENYRAIRDAGIKVSIDGHGSDELLGGYAFYLPIPIGNLNNTLYHQFHQGLLPSILRNYDRCSMASGVEVRMPFMDFRLVSFAFSCPDSDKIGNGYTKSILRASMAGIMPEAIRTRRNKIGFNSPLPALFNDDLLPLLGLITSTSIWKENPWWGNSLEVGEILKKARTRSWVESDWPTLLQLWTLVNLCAWILTFIENKFPQLGNTR